MDRKQFNFELKQINDSDDSEFYVVEGIASDNSIDRAYDIVKAGVVTASVEKYGMPKFFHQHKMDEPLGIFTEIKQVGDNTFVKAEIPKGVDEFDKIVKLVKMGAYGGFSIGFNTLDAEWEKEVRIIKEIELLEISLVTIPCNQNAVVTGAKSDNNEENDMNIEDAKTLGDVEAVLKTNYSAKDSKSIISKISELKQDERDAELEQAKKAEEAERDAELKSLAGSFDELNDMAKQFTKEEK